MVRRKDQPVMAMFSITLNNLWLCLTEQSMLAYWKLDQHRAFQKTPPAMACGQHYRCRKICLDIHLQFPCYLSQLVLIFCFILDVILKNLCKVLVFVVIETHNFGCFWLKNIEKKMTAETLVMWICWKRMYVIYKICPSREYFNLVLFNIIVERDYILTTRNKKDKKFTLIAIGRRDFFANSELRQCSSSSILMEGGFGAHSVDPSHQIAWHC